MLSDWPRQTTFSRLGGLQLDREVRALSSFLTSLTSWSIRERFARLHHIAALLNLETLQELELECFGGATKLTPVEVSKLPQPFIEWILSFAYIKLNFGRSDNFCCCAWISTRKKLSGCDCSSREWCSVTRGLGDIICDTSLQCRSDYPGSGLQ